VVDYSGRVPKFLLKWLNWSSTWQSFSFDFLKSWGGRFAPSLEGGHWWLWFTSFYLHQNLQHIISNMLLFVAMSVHLELNYGWWRLLLVWVISGALSLSWKLLMVARPCCTLCSLLHTGLVAP
jgi:membrane associated rhomboid family serine protease